MKTPLRFAWAVLLFWFPSIATPLNIPYVYKSAGVAAKLDPARLYHAPLGSVGPTTADSGLYASRSDTVQNFDCPGNPQPYKYLSFGVVSSDAQPVRLRFSMDATSVAALSNIRFGVQNNFRDFAPAASFDSGIVTLRPSEETFFVLRFDYADPSKGSRVSLSAITLDNGSGADPQNIFFTPGPPDLPSPKSDDPAYYARIGDAYVGGVGRVQGILGLYRTDLTLLNTTANGMRMYLSFVDRSGDVVTRSVDLLPFRTASYPNVAESLFKLTSSSLGYIVVHGYASPDSTGIYSSRDDISARTYIDNGPKGTEGVALATRPAFDYYFCPSATTAAYQIVGTGIASGSYYTNIALYPVSGESGVARIRIFDKDSTLVGEGTLEVRGFVQQRLYDYLNVPPGERRGDYVVVDAPFFLAGYVSVIDNTSGNNVTRNLGRGWTKK